LRFNPQPATYVPRTMHPYGHVISRPNQNNGPCDAFALSLVDSDLLSPIFKLRRRKIRLASYGHLLNLKFPPNDSKQSNLFWLPVVFPAGLHKSLTNVICVLFPLSGGSTDTEFLDGSTNARTAALQTLFHPSQLDYPIRSNFNCQECVQSTVNSFDSMINTINQDVACGISVR
jgi:hypothetical protein